jgi:hypothetical protein
MSPGRHGFGRGPQMGTKLESVDAQKGTMKNILGGASRRMKPKYVHCSNRVHFVKRNFNLIANLILNIAGKPTSKVTVVTLLIYIRIFTSKHPLPLFSCIRYVIQ